MNKETARTSDLYKSDFLIKPLSKGQEMQPPSTSGFGAMNNSLGTALPGVSTSVFSLKKPSVQVNEFDKDANKEVDIDELNQLLSLDLNKGDDDYEIKFTSQKQNPDNDSRASFPTAHSQSRPFNLLKDSRNPSFNNMGNSGGTNQFSN